MWWKVFVAYVVVCMGSEACAVSCVMCAFGVCGVGVRGV